MSEFQSQSLPVISNAAVESRQKPADIESLNIPHWRDAFDQLDTAEAGALIKNLFGILPQRGCLQSCMGCHAAALKRLVSANWDTVDTAIHLIAEASKDLDIEVQSLIPNPDDRLIETFRDSDPAHFRFRSNDSDEPLKGAGDFAELVSSVLKTKIKIMTAGAWMATVKGDPDTASNKVYHDDLAQLKHASFYAGRISVSVSKQTLQYRKLGVDADAKIIAETFMSCVEGSAPETPVFLDMMYFTADGKDAETESHRELFTKVLEHIDESILSTEEREVMMDYIYGNGEPINGSANNKWMLPEKQIGIRVSPYLNIGRAQKDKKKGQNLKETKVSNQLALLDGNPTDIISFTAEGTTEHYTRRELQDPEAMSAFVDKVRTLGRGSFLADKVSLKGNWFEFFRAEIDLSPPISGVSDKLASMAPGSNLPIGINLIMSDIEGGELQVVVPFKSIVL